jgi:hypothetical protein
MGEWKGVARQALSSNSTRGLEQEGMGKEAQQDYLSGFSVIEGLHLTPGILGSLAQKC